jgi:hypothetical protein
MVSETPASDFGSKKPTRDTPGRDFYADHEGSSRPKIASGRSVRASAHPADRALGQLGKTTYSIKVGFRLRLTIFVSSMPPQPSMSLALSPR